MEPILEAKKLNLWYGPNHALHDVSIAIPEHEITAFIGPSGCGKSTFLRTLNRMNDLIPSVKLSGEVDFHGQDLYGSSVDPTWLRKQIGMVFQKANPFPMSIYDNVAYGPRTHGIRNRVKLDEIVENSLRSAAIGNEFVKMIFVSFLNSNIYPLKNLPTSRVCIFLETPYSKASSHFPIASHLQ